MKPQRMTKTSPFVSSLFGIQLGIAGHVFGFRPSEVLGISHTARGLRLDMLLAPKILTVKYQGLSALPELAGQIPGVEPAPAGDTGKGVMKTRNKLISKGLKEKIDIKTGKRLK